MPINIDPYPPHKKQYQDIFDWCQDTGALPLESEMNDLINIIYGHAWRYTSDLFDENGKMTGPVKEYIIWDAKNKRPRMGTTITIFGNLTRFTHYIDMDVLSKPKEENK